MAISESSTKAKAKPMSDFNCKTCSHPKHMHEIEEETDDRCHADGGECQCKLYIADYPKKVPQERREQINHPRHYNIGKYEVIDVIEDWKLGFNLGNAVKYIARAEHKNGVEDIKKAIWYLQRYLGENKKNG